MPSLLVVLIFSQPSEHATFVQRLLSVIQPSATFGQRWVDVVPTTRVCWESLTPSYSKFQGGQRTSACANNGDILCIKRKYNLLDQTEKSANVVRSSRYGVPRGSKALIEIDLYFKNTGRPVFQIRVNTQKYGSTRICTVRPVYLRVDLYCTGLLAVMGRPVKYPYSRPVLMSFIRNNWHWFMKFSHLPDDSGKVTMRAVFRRQHFIKR